VYFWNSHGYLCHLSAHGKSLVLQNVFAVANYWKPVQHLVLGYQQIDTAKNCEMDREGQQEGLLQVVVELVSCTSIASRQHYNSRNGRLALCALSILPVMEGGPSPYV
jgi:hypothetical protein